MQTKQKLSADWAEETDRGQRREGERRGEGREEGEGQLKERRRINNTQTDEHMCGVQDNPATTRPAQRSVADRPIPHRQALVTVVPHHAAHQLDGRHRSIGHAPAHSLSVGNPSFFVSVLSAMRVSELAGCGVGFFSTRPTKRATDQENDSDSLVNNFARCGVVSRKANRCRPKCSQRLFLRLGRRRGRGLVPPPPRRSNRIGVADWASGSTRERSCTHVPECERLAAVSPAGLQPCACALRCAPLVALLFVYQRNHTTHDGFASTCAAAASGDREANKASANFETDPARISIWLETIKTEQGDAILTHSTHPSSVSAPSPARLVPAKARPCLAADSSMIHRSLLALLILEHLS
jgi:hypothetical protein